jgi:hypothetical protein
MEGRFDGLLIKERMMGGSRVIVQRGTVRWALHCLICLWA